MKINIFDVLESGTGVRALLLSFCDKNDLFQLALACKRLSDTCLYQTDLTLRRGVPVGVLCSMYSKLVHLTIRDTSTTNELLRSTRRTATCSTYNRDRAMAGVRDLSPLGMMQHLTSTRVRQNYLLPSHVQLFTEFMPMLEKLDMSGVRFTEGALTSLLNGLSSQLKVLDISDTTDDRKINFTFPQGLRYLNASNIYVGGNEMQEFASAIRSCTYLEEVYEPTCPFRACYDVYSNLIMSAPLLRSISSSTTCTALADLLQARSSRMESLSTRLSGNPTETGGFFTRLADIQTLPKLRLISVTGILSEDGWEISQLVQKSPRVQDLSFGGPTNYVCPETFDFLDNATTLEYLRVDGNFFGGAVDRLMTKISSMQHLKRLIIRSYSYLQQVERERLQEPPQHVVVVLEDFSPADKEN